MTSAASLPVAAPTPAERSLVARPGLAGRLSATPPGGVALVCAPAGSGKTTLLRSWLRGSGQSGAWVSVERGERDAQRFWLAVVDAVGRAAGDGPVERVGPSPTFAGEAVVTRLLAGLRSLDHPLVLVIDDLHELHSREALELLEVFIAHLPATTRLVLGTREDPGLGLHRLRVAGMLVELDGTDLAFSAEEAGALLAAGGVALSPESMALLSDRTEGWAAGLRLAVLSLTGHPNPDRFVREFSGSERTVAAYLMAEVLERQPPDVRQLLLRTSVLERLSGPLADRLSGSSGAEGILQRLAEANAFVTPLDAGRTWFRYHHLFADLLRLELRRTAPGMTAELHRSAARWYEERGDAIEAVRHAQAAEDWPHAVRLLADHSIALILDARPRTVRALLERFPPRVAAGDPELALIAAAARIPDAAIEDAVGYLAVAERLAGDVPAERRARFELERAVVKLALARRRSDFPTVVETMTAVEAALAEPLAGGVGLGPDLRASALMDLGIAETWSSRLADARRHLDDAVALARRLDRPYLEVAGLAHLALANMLSGRRLSAALELSEQASSLAEARGLAEDPVVATACAVSASVHVWQGRFDEAARCLDRGERTVRSEGEPATELIVHNTRGQLRLAQGRLEEALTAFRAAERVRARLVDVQLPSIEPWRGAALTLSLLGDAAGARAALAAIPARDRRRVDVRTVAAAVALAGGDPESAAEVLAATSGEVPQDGPRWVGLELALLEAVAHHQLGDRRRATEGLERALDAAEPDSLLLPFLVLPVEELLQGHPRHHSAHGTLLSEILDLRAGNAPPPRGPPAWPQDELSDAELRVVRYLPTNLKAAEIAAELVVSTNTVRTHVTHIYRKLGAHSRGEAVARARELGLLGPSSRRR